MAKKSGFLWVLLVTLFCSENVWSLGGVPQGTPRDRRWAYAIAITEVDFPAGVSPDTRIELWVNRRYVGAPPRRPLRNDDFEAAVNADPFWAEEIGSLNLGRVQGPVLRRLGPNALSARVAASEFNEQWRATITIAMFEDYAAGTRRHTYANRFMASDLREFQVDLDLDFPQLGVPRDQRLVLPNGVIVRVVDMNHFCYVSCENDPQALSF